MSEATQGAYTGRFSNWMSGLDSALTMAQLSVPGTHDSGTAKIKMDAYHTQNFGIGQQLTDGIRFLDIRLTTNSDKKASATDPLQVNHGNKSCDLTFGEVLTHCSKFLQTNPGEAIFMLVNDAGGSATDETVYDGFQIYLQESNWQNLFCLSPTCSQLPLSQLRGKVVLLRRFWAPDDAVLGLNLQQQPGTFDGVGWPNNNSATFSTATPDGQTSLYIEDQFNNHDTGSKMQAVSDALTLASANADDGRLYLSFNSIAYGNAHTPYDYAWSFKKSPMNPALQSWLQARPGKARFGFVMLDYYNNENGNIDNRNVTAVINANF